MKIRPHGTKLHDLKEECKMAQFRAVQIFSGEVLAASGAATSASVEIGKANAISIHHNETSGTGTVAYTYALSNKSDGTFITPVSAVTIGTGITADDILDFAPEAAAWIQITATEDGAANSITFSAELSIQEL